MKNFKKFTALGLAAIMIAGLAACGSPKETANTADDKQTQTPAEQTQAPADSEALTGATVTLMASQDWIQDAEMELGEKFTEETGIKIDYQIVPADQYLSLLMTKLNTGECTDIFCGQSGKFDIQTSFNVAKNAMDLSQENWAKNVDKLAADELSIDGKLYGQPIQDVSAVWAVAYNKAIFEELKLNIPTTYDEFKTVCDAILAAGKTPIYECVSDGWHHTLWFPEPAVQAGVLDSTLVDKLNNNEAVFEGNETLLTILNQIKDMADSGYWGDNYMSNEYANAAQNLASGDYVMTLANQGFGTEVNAADPNFPEDNIGYFVMPLADNQTLNMNPSGPSRFIYSGSENAEAAKKYLEFMASDESLAYMTENVAKFNKLPFSNAPSAYSETVQEFYDRYSSSGTVFQTAVKYVNPQWTEMGNDISALLLGEVTPGEMLKNIDKLRTEQAVAAGDEAWNE